MTLAFRSWRGGCMVEPAVPGDAPSLQIWACYFTMRKLASSVALDHMLCNRPACQCMPMHCPCMHVQWAGLMAIWAGQ